MGGWLLVLMQILESRRTHTTASTVIQAELLLLIIKSIEYATFIFLKLVKYYSSHQKFLLLFSKLFNLLLQ